MISPVKIWRRQKKIAELLGRIGVVITWTTIYVPGKAFTKYAPYTVVLVEFEDKERAFGQLVNYAEKHLKIGTHVQAILRKVREVAREDVIPYGIKFKPVEK